VAVRLTRSKTASPKAGSAVLLSVAHFTFKSLHRPKIPPVCGEMTLPCSSQGRFGFLRSRVPDAPEKSLDHTAHLPQISFPVKPPPRSGKVPSSSDKRMVPPLTGGIPARSLARPLQFTNSPFGLRQCKLWRVIPGLAGDLAASRALPLAMTSTPGIPLRSLRDHPLS
jgi:hypothetical protein